MPNIIKYILFGFTFAVAIGVLVWLEMHSNGSASPFGFSFPAGANLPPFLVSRKSQGAVIAGGPTTNQYSSFVDPSESYNSPILFGMGG